MHHEMDYLLHLDSVADQDARALRRASLEYGASFSKRGGVGHFMMLARKWDRIEQAICEEKLGLPKYDIYARTAADDRPEGLIDDIRDLRRYLILVEAELLSRGQLAGHLPKDTYVPRPAPVHLTSAGMDHPFGFDAEKE